MSSLEAVHPREMLVASALVTLSEVGAEGERMSPDNRRGTSSVAPMSGASPQKCKGCPSQAATKERPVTPADPRSTIGETVVGASAGGALSAGSTRRSPTPLGMFEPAPDQSLWCSLHDEQPR